MTVTVQGYFWRILGACAYLGTHKLYVFSKHLTSSLANSSDCLDIAVSLCFSWLCHTMSLDPILHCIKLHLTALHCTNIQCSTVQFNILQSIAVSAVMHSGMYSDRT